MKVYTYVMISVILVIFFNLAGLLTHNDILKTIGYSNNDSNITFNPLTKASDDDSLGETLYNRIFSTNTGILLLAGLATGITIGFLTKSKPENFIILPIITAVLFLFLGAYTEITTLAFNYSGWLGGITLLLLGAHTIGFMISFIEFFRGTD